jgi:hypothetical protein
MEPSDKGESRQKYTQATLQDQRTSATLTLKAREFWNNEEV